MIQRLVLLCSLSAAILWAQNPAPIRSWSEAETLESNLDSHPGDVDTRLQLLRYYAPQGSDSTNRVKPLRRKHILWFIEHEPWHNELSGWTAAIDRSVDPEGFDQANDAWRKALAVPKPLFDTYANAADFLKAADPARSRQIADEGLVRYPGNARLQRTRGELMAAEIAGVKSLGGYGRAPEFADAPGPDAERDRTILESSDDTNLISGAAQALQNHIPLMHSKKLDARLPEIEDLIVRLYRRADEIDPNQGRWKSSLVYAYRNIAFVAGTPAEKIAILEKGRAIAPNPSSRAALLPDLGEQYLAAGNTAKAAEAARELLASDQDKNNPGYGSNPFFTANLLLGRIELKQGDAADAARWLLAAGHAYTSQPAYSQGPTDWRLVRDLLDAGDRDSVLAYLNLLRDNWKNDNGRLDTWVSAIRSGGTPDFTPGIGFAQESHYVGNPAPEFRLKNLKGDEVALADFKGKVVLLDFWATWCGPCREEMPAFEKIHREQDVVVLAVDANEPVETVAPFIEKQKYTFPVLLANGADVVSRYNVNAYPTTFAIDKNGLVAEILVGNGPGRLDSAIAKARAGAPPPKAAPISSRPAAPARSKPASPPPPTPSVTAEDFYRDAVRLRGQSDYAGALKALAHALELRPDWITAALTMAQVYSSAKQYDDAIAAYGHVIQLDPSRAASYDSRGLAYSNSGRHPQAIPDYTRAIELNPELTAAYNNRGWADLELGHLAEALTDLNKAIELNPAYTTALFNRAHLLEKQKEYAKAVEDYDRILHIAPADTQASNQKTADLRKMEPGIAGDVAHAKLPNPVLHCHGSMEIPQTYEWSLDDDCRVAPGGDFWYEDVDADTRYLTPRGGAMLAVMGNQSAGYDGCSTAKFTADKVSLASLKKGSYLCAKTSKGAIAEFSYDDLYAKDSSRPDVLTLVISYKTWEP
jgi:tetratricopeptide (TPR) repeat protein